MAALLVVTLCLGCSGRKEQFLEGRALDTCSQSWPACTGFAGCLLGTQSYIEGRFPNTGKFVVQVAEPSTIQVSFFIEEVEAAGNELVLTWNEGGCRAQTRISVTGRALVQESEQAGYFSREADVSDLDDHLIEFESDAQARYTLKVDVTPTRLKNP